MEKGRLHSQNSLRHLSIGISNVFTFSYGMILLATVIEDKLLYLIISIQQLYIQSLKIQQFTGSDMTLILGKCYSKFCQSIAFFPNSTQHNNCVQQIQYRTKSKGTEQHQRNILTSSHFTTWMKMSMYLNSLGSLHLNYKERA